MLFKQYNFRRFRLSTSAPGQDVIRLLHHYVHGIKLLLRVMFIMIPLISLWSGLIVFHVNVSSIFFFYILHEQTCASSCHRSSQIPSTTSLTKIPTCKTRASALPHPRPNSTPCPFSTGSQDSLSINRNVEKVRKGPKLFS